MRNLLGSESQFTQTRLILSLWYTGILFLILLGFSVALSITYSNDVARIVLRQDFGNNIPRTLSSRELRLIQAQVWELRDTSRTDLIIIDFATLLVGAGLSYFLAGKTLTPIQKNMESQKLFVADASHELKNPVATIQSACEVSLRSNTKTKDDYKKVIEQVFEQCQRLGRLINDLLLLSVLDSEQIRQLKLCSLSTIIEKELDIMKPIFKKSDLILEQKIEPGIQIFGDADKLGQLIIILMDNAIKFTSPGGRISIQLIGKPQPKLIVGDTGIGIPEEKQEAIFRRFYQTDNSRSGSGAGLGLSIAESIMKLHKGKIEVKSIPGKGSIFTCTFPNYTRED